MLKEFEFQRDGAIDSRSVRFDDRRSPHMGRYTLAHS
jgi:hypothetical protein